MYKSKNMHQIIIGIPSYNESDSIGFVTKKVDRGLQKYFHNITALIINVDNSPDRKTKDAFLKTKTKTSKKYIHTKAQHGYKGTNLRILFKYFISTKADVLAILDADLTSNDPEWIKFLVSPILGGYDHIFPYYKRHQYDGTITNLICYPIVKGVLGRGIRQPIGGEMAFSRRVVKKFLKNKWPISAHRFGVDIFMTLISILNNMKIGQVYLGSKRHKPSAPKLNDMFIDVVSTVLTLFKRNKIDISRNFKEVNYPMINNIYKNTYNKVININIKNIANVASDDFKLQKKYLAYILGNEKIMRIERDNYINSIEWADILCTFLKLSKKESAVKLSYALRPLYFLRLFSYYKETDGKDYNGAMDVIEDQIKILRNNCNK